MSFKHFRQIKDDFYRNREELNISAKETRIELRLFVDGMKIGFRICPSYTFILSVVYTSKLHENAIEAANTLESRLDDQFQLLTHKPGGLIGQVKLYPVTEKILPSV